jgi:hypothetical protein
MPTIRDTADLLDLKRRIAKLSPGGRLRVAAACLDAGIYDIAEALAGQIVDELRAGRLLRNASEQEPPR